MSQGSAMPELIPKGPRRRMKRRRDPRKTSSSGKHVFRESTEPRKVKLRWAQRVVKKLGLPLRCATRSHQRALGREVTL